MLPVASHNISRIAWTKSITTQRYGIHYFCFINNGPKARVAFQISIGHKAKDFGSPLGGNDLLGAL